MTRRRGIVLFVAGAMTWIGGCGPAGENDLATFVGDLARGALAAFLL